MPAIVTLRGFLKKKTEKEINLIANATFFALGDLSQYRVYLTPH